LIMLFLRNFLVELLVGSKTEAARTPARKQLLTCREVHEPCPKLGLRLTEIVRLRGGALAVLGPESESDAVLLSRHLRK
jgi:hypothetical protein